MRWLLPYLVTALCVSISCGNILDEDYDYDGSGSGDKPDDHKTPQILPDSENVTLKHVKKKVDNRNNDIAFKINDTQNANEDKSGNVTTIKEAVDKEKNINETEQAVNADTSTAITNTTVVDESTVVTTTTSTSTSLKTTTSKSTSLKTKSTSVATTVATTSTTEATSNKAASFFNFNLNYLYFLLLLIPLAGIITGIIYFCKRKKRKGYADPNVRADIPRRFSTPSWVFSEPDFADEEVITLKEEEKK